MRVAVVVQQFTRATASRVGASGFVTALPLWFA